MDYCTESHESEDFDCRHDSNHILRCRHIRICQGEEIHPSLYCLPTLFEVHDLARDELILLPVSCRRVLSDDLLWHSKAYDMTCSFNLLGYLMNYNCHTYLL